MTNLNILSYFLERLSFNENENKKNIFEDLFEDFPDFCPLHHLIT